MRRSIALVAATVVLATAGAASAATVEIRDAVARVTVIPEDRSDVKVEFLTTNRDLPLTVRMMGADAIIDGGFDHRITGCHPRHENSAASVRGLGRIKYEEVPQVVVCTPRVVVVRANGVADSLDAAFSGLGKIHVRQVTGSVSRSVTGGGHVTIGDRS